MNKPYVYEIECVPIKKRYIGSRTKVNKNGIDILKEYFTSSAIIKLLIEQYGVENFKIINIIECESILECIKLEDTLLREITNKSEYINQNFAAGGAVIKNQSHTCITKGDGVFLYYPRDIDVPKDYYIKWPGTPPRHGGKIKIINPENKHTTLCYPNNIIEGYLPIHDYNLSIKKPKRNIWITNNIKNTKISNVNELPEGWRLGKTIKNNGGIGRKPGHKGTTLGKTSITDGVKNKFIYLTEGIPSGWRKGSTQPPRIIGKKYKRKI